MMALEIDEEASFSVLLKHIKQDQVISYRLPKTFNLQNFMKLLKVKPKTPDQLCI